MMKKTPAVLLSALVITIAFCSEAQALGIPGLGWGYTIGYGAAKWTGLATPYYTGLTPYSIWWDPPASALDGRVTFAYDPALITVFPELSGFVGDFSNNPAINVPFAASEVYPLFDMSTIPGPRPGMIYDLSVGVDTVTLTFDVSANPVTVPAGTGSINFFGLAIGTKVPLSGFRIEDTNIGQFHEIGSLNDQSQTYMHCSDSIHGIYNCGETNSPTRGFGLTAVPTPEPSTWLLLSIGFLGLLGRRHMKQSPA
jgi:PEP-CTERM motif-containing protein